MSDLLVCRDLFKVYNEGAVQTPVLNGVNFSMQEGELTAIVGSSGSGKSTLLHILGALDKPSQGEVEFKGIDLMSLSGSKQAKLRNQDIGFVYQFHHLLADFTALENVAMPLLIAGKTMKVAEKEAQLLLNKMGLGKRAEHRPSELSGGERQRVAIARALVTKPSLVLADEPTGNLDHNTALEIYALMRDLNAEFNIAFLVVTHDLNLANKLDRQVTMQDGVLNAINIGALA